MLLRRQCITQSLTVIKDPPGPCRTEFSDVGFDFIVVSTNH